MGASGALLGLWTHIKEIIMYDIVIIGAGVAGGMIARELSRFELDICLLEKENDVAAGATKANSAIVHAGFDAEEGTLKAKMNVRGSEMMERVCSELGVKYKNNGSLVIAFSEEDEEHLNELLERGKSNGVGGLEIVRGERLFELEPKLSRRVRAALYAPTGAIVCPYELCIASVGNAMDNGADLRCDFEVVDICDNNGTYTVKGASGEEISTRYVINCAGIYSDKVCEMAERGEFFIHARRGEYILLDREAGDIVSHTIFRTPGKMGKGILVTPTVDGNLLVGPTSVDIEDKNDRSIGEEAFYHLIAQANENIEGGLPFGKTITSFCGLRAVGSTGDFIINLKNRFLNVAGIESPGLSSAPAIAEYVCELLKNDGLELEEKSDFDPIRKPSHLFHEMSIEEKNEMIKKNPAYGKIVCRCETISEGEILDAIRTNPPANDIDGVKRRTRAGMGRCQGGFCGTYVMELIAREKKIPLEAVTKSGGKSHLVYGRTK